MAYVIERESRFMLMARRGRKGLAGGGHVGTAAREFCVTGRPAVFHLVARDLPGHLTRR